MRQLLLWKGSKIDTGERLMAALPFAFGTEGEASVPIWDVRKKLSRGGNWLRVLSRCFDDEYFSRKVGVLVMVQLLFWKGSEELKRESA
jgi:hypothetical protein